MNINLLRFIHQQIARIMIFMGECILIGIIMVNSLLLSISINPYDSNSIECNIIQHWIWLRDDDKEAGGRYDRNRDRHRHAEAKALNQIQCCMHRLTLWASSLSPPTSYYHYILLLLATSFFFIINTCSIIPISSLPHSLTQQQQQHKRR